MHTARNRCLFLVVLLMLLSQTLAQTTFTINCPDTVTYGQSFWYEVKAVSLHGLGMKPVTFKDFALEDYEFPRGYEIVDSVKKQMFTARFRLKPRAMGDYVLPTLTMTWKEETVSVPSVNVKVVPPVEYAVEYKEAFHCLVSQGMDAQSLHLVKQPTDNMIVLFSDDESHCFAAVAARQYASMLNGNTVLAFSTEAPIHSLTQGCPEWIFKSYEEQLRLLAQKQTNRYQSDYKEQIKPLLGDMAWGQKFPYNSLCPEQVVAGCGPIALGQIMKFYNFPLRGQRNVGYKQNNQLVRYDLGQLNINWKVIQPRYRNTENDASVIQPIASLVKAVGIATGAEFGKERTSTKTSQYRTALINNFGYSVTAQTVKNANTDTRLSLARKELTAGRPMIVMGGNHTYVLDGCDGEYMHYNLGWDGFSNGYYRTLLAEDGELAFTSMVIGLEPSQQQREVACQVSLEKPGTLLDLLNEDKMKTITRLSVTGSLNNQDVAVLRRMAGAEDESSGNQPRGRLTELDLSNARFVTDTTSCFLCYPANDYKVTFSSRETTIRNGKQVANAQIQRIEYDFSNMTHEQWEEFVSRGLHSNESYYLTEENGLYLINCHTCDSVVSQRMWYNCENLRLVKLPSHIKKIADHAFEDCSLLLSLDIPDECTELGKEVFLRCTALESVTYNDLIHTSPSNKQNAIRDANPLLSGLTKR